MLLAGCGLKLPDQINLPTQITGGDPRTLEAATAAGQEVADRQTSGDSAGVWLMMSKQVRNNISQADYVTLQNACSKSGLPAHVTGVRMDGPTVAIVRWNVDLPVLSGFKVTKTMVYEDGKWALAPDSDYAQDYSLPVQQIIAKRQAAGECDKSATPPATSSTPTPATTTTAQQSPERFRIPGTRYAFPASYSAWSPAQERPAALNFEHRFHELANLSWTSWGPDGAEGTGDETVQTGCTPDCASGPRYTNPVRIRASNPQVPSQDTGCPADVQYYTDVVIAYPTTVPPHEPSWSSVDGSAVEWTTDSGLTGAHYSSWKPECST